MKDEIIKVFTKYDTPYTGIDVPHFISLTAHAFTDLTNLVCDEMAMMEHVKYTVKGIECGLEGVRYFHYGKA